VYFESKSEVGELFSSALAAAASETNPLHSTRNVASNPVGQLGLIRK
jgi:hypothetical protein